MSIFSDIGDVCTSVVDDAGDAAKSMVDGAGDLAKGYVNGVGDAAGFVGGAASDLYQGATSLFGDAAGFVLNAGLAGPSLIPLFGSAVGAAENAIPQLLDGASSLASGLIDPIRLQSLVSLIG